MSQYYIIDLAEESGDDLSGEYTTVTLEPTDGSGTLVVAFNSSCGTSLSVGDILPPYTPLSDGVMVVDFINEPGWWAYHYLTEETEIKKYFSFAIKLGKLHLSWAQLGALMTTYLYHIKPTFTTAIFTREDTTPLFLVGDYTYLDYVQVTMAVGGDSYIPADSAYQKSFGNFYYKSNERQISTTVFT